MVASTSFTQEIANSCNLNLYQEIFNDYLKDKIPFPLNNEIKKQLLDNIFFLIPNQNLANNLFFKAILNEDLDIVSKLISSQKIDVNTTAKNGYSALLYSCDLNNLELATLLLQNSANPNFKEDKGETPLMHAAIYSNVEMINLLLFYGAQINDKNFKGISALMFSASNKKYENSKALLSSNANIEDSDTLETTVLMEAVSQIRNNLNDQDLELIKILLDKTQNIEAKNSLGETALMRTQNIKIAEMLLEKKASLSIRNNQGQTPLLTAAKRGLDGLIDLYVANGASILEKDNYDWTALMFASNTKNNISTIEKVLEYSSKNINNLSKENLTALEIACHHKNEAAKTLLLQNGARETMNILFYSRDFEAITPLEAEVLILNLFWIDTTILYCFY